eukprot:Partr_v1_DN26958_c0_g1_i1_m7010 putative pelota homolog
MCRRQPKWVRYRHYCSPILYSGILIVSDGLLQLIIWRSSDVITRKKHIALADHCKKMGATVHIFSSLHTSGEQLGQMTGIAAVLSFPCPTIEDEIEEEEKRHGQSK